MTCVIHAPRLKDLQKALDRASKEFRARTYTVNRQGDTCSIYLHDGDGQHVATVINTPDQKVKE